MLIDPYQSGWELELAKWCTPLHGIASYRRATAYDKGDLVSANREDNEELRDFEESIAERGRGKPRAQIAGFHNKVSSEWEEVAGYWRFKKPDEAMMHFFDEYVHDSRSAFKPLGEKSESEALAALKKWSRELKTRNFNTSIARTLSLLGRDQAHLTMA